ncbi:hypothetical protein BDV96DRAFT_640069 [Lophiotrema nucula]|uniref:BTB domain-containing protein n=1 Tax=Lophiotrema nucula TaxID=690887 RepID=A0A6A5ZQP0_9PLEO|nr:hypothetical protein BDV96DRAFT_640069 [Lophiotrema nucula]
MAESKIVWDSTSKLEYFRGRCIRIEVGRGDEVEVFGAHRAVLTESSEFFARALRRDWKESQDNIVQLPEDEPRIFELFLHFLYDKKIPIKAVDPNLEHLSAAEVHAAIEKQLDAEFSSLCKLYVLGEKLQDVAVRKAVLIALMEGMEEPRADGGLWTPDVLPVDIAYEGNKINEEYCKFCELYVLSEYLSDVNAKDLVVVALYQGFDHLRLDQRYHSPNHEHVNIVYRGTPESSPLRILLRDLYVLRSQSGWFNKNLKDPYCAEFIFDILLGLLKI